MMFAICRSTSDQGWICELDLGHGGPHGSGCPSRHSSEDADQVWSEDHNWIQAERNRVLTAILDGYTRQELPARVELSQALIAWHAQELISEDLIDADQLGD